MGRFFDAFRPIARFLPEVTKPAGRVGFNEKLFWTGVVLIVYLVMRLIPLWGVGTTGSEDPFLPIRVVLGGHRGGLLELGIGPIVTGGLILQLLIGAGMISYDSSNPDDRAMLTAASKFLALVMTAVSAVAFVVGGAYGSLSPLAGALVIIQLLSAGMLLMMMDEMLQKGWGIGSGISLFILAGVAQELFWSTFSPMPAGEYVRGSVFAYFQAVLSGKNPLVAFYERELGLPTMLGLVTTIAILVVVIYLEGVSVKIPIVHARYRGFSGQYPVKLLYVSNIPVILASALFADVYLLSNIIRGSPISSSIIGDIVGRFNGSQPVSGLVYYISPPRTLSEIALDPFRAVAYMAILLSICVAFSLVWLSVSGMDAQSVAKQLVESGVQVPGFRRATQPISALLSRYITTVTVLGGFLVGLIAALGDFLGVYGTGTGILLSVGIIYQYYEIIMRERIAELHPGLERILGGGKVG
ncbi:MAG: preprotein translocase subunit SecY [Candidatus Brockarchaeota archaeon]|nr:preprotein translocase subunit SecY [Candidatus Brockarchaeota archaeon]